MARKKSPEYLSPIGLLRIISSTLLIVHGVARIYTHSVDDFGLFLESKGFPQPLLLAWAVSVFEVVGGLLLVAGRWIALLSLLFVLEIGLGVYLVHYPEGWFVVGLGRNGMEFGVLLIFNFLVIGWDAWKRS